eukprot:m.891167 g.891167  ORF g.891167 m.891167 type:complete len:65 (+) comp59961_c1_seq2:953-1147(+)
MTFLTDNSDRLLFQPRSGLALVVYSYSHSALRPFDPCLSVCLSVSLAVVAFTGMCTRCLAVHHQ